MMKSLKANAVGLAVFACVAVSSCACAYPYFDPQPGWPPRPLTELNGRKLELFAHGVRPEWGYAAQQEDAFAVVHPACGKDRRGAPLVVVLHSAGHSLATVLRCARQPGNHDIYATPDDMYALYVDCKYNEANDWWWGASKGLGRFELSPCEKRIMDTIEWTASTYGVDRNRIYLCGNSMGGSGTLGLGLRHGDVFAAIKANVPAHVKHAARRMGFGRNEVPDGFAFADPPVTVDYSSQTDSWSEGHEAFIAGMAERQYPLMMFWGAFGHANNNGKIAKCNDIIHDFDWLAVRKDEAYPAFTGATSDNRHPWPVQKAADGKTALDLRPGQINGFFRWRTVRDESQAFAMDLWLAAPETKFDELKAPDRATATVALRRLQKFQAGENGRFAWTFGEQWGVANRLGAVCSIPGLEIAREKKTLILRPAKDQVE